MDNKTTLEKLTLRTSTGNKDFFCPSLYLRDNVFSVPLSVYEKSQIIFDPYWDHIKHAFVKYSRYYTDFSSYMYDLNAFAVFYSQMTFTSRIVYNIPAYKYDENCTQSKGRQAIDYLIMLAIRLKNFEKINERIISISENPNAIIPEFANGQLASDEPETFIWKPDNVDVTEKTTIVDAESPKDTSLWYQSKDAIDTDILKLRDNCTGRYLTIINSLYDNALETSQRDVKVQMLKMIGDTLTSYIKEIDIVADKLYEDVQSCQN